MKTLEDMETLREELAELCHSQWSGWMAYLFSKSKLSSDGTCNIPKEFVDRWKRQTDAHYKHLSKNEMDSDRKEADKFLALMGASAALLELKRHREAMEVMREGLEIIKSEPERCTDKHISPPWAMATEALKRGDEILNGEMVATEAKKP